MNPEAWHVIMPGAMFSFLQRDLPAAGRVLYPGAIGPPLEQLSALREPVTCTRTTPSPDQVWAIAATHPLWGAADIACLRQLMPVPAELIDHTLSLSDDEKARARMGETAVAVRVSGQQKNILRDRKRLLCWLRALMQADGAVAIDLGSMLLWSQAMLDDELAHDADLDIESLVYDPRGAGLAGPHACGVAAHTRPGGASRVRP